MPLAPNPGHLPDPAKGKRVRVVLRNGYDTAKRESRGWPADGSGGCDWRLTGSNWDIMQWEVIG